MEKVFSVCVCSRFREKLGVKTVKALKRNNNGVTHAAVDMLCALMCVSSIEVSVFGFIQASSQLQSCYD